MAAKNCQIGMFFFAFSISGCGAQKLRQQGNHAIGLAMVLLLDTINQIKGIPCIALPLFCCRLPWPAPRLPHWQDTKQLSALMLGTNILFTNPPNADIVSKIRETDDASFDGLRSGGYHAFARSVRDPKKTLREDFYNLNIIQDGHLAWVFFGFDFVASDKVVNHGVEAWQLLKTGDGKWKIFSVVWSSKGAPK